jgi:NADH dehydrogenase FAD-containing subunit
LLSLAYVLPLPPSPFPFLELTFSSLQRQAEEISKATSILIAGGGALGIQYASDIADLYNNPENKEHLKPFVKDGKLPPKKKITIVHSRDRFLPLYKQEMHDEIVRRLEVLGVEIIFGERVPLPPQSEDKPGEKRSVKLKDGREIEYDYLVRLPPIFLCSSRPDLRSLDLTFPLST